MSPVRAKSVLGVTLSTATRRCGGRRQWRSRGRGDGGAVARPRGRPTRTHARKPVYSRTATPLHATAADPSTPPRGPPYRFARYYYYYARPRYTTIIISQVCVRTGMHLYQADEHVPADLYAMCTGARPFVQRPRWPDRAGGKKKNKCPLKN